MKRRFAQIIACCLLAAMLLALPAGAVTPKTVWINPYQDVTETMWSYNYIRALNQAGVLPDGETFGGSEQETRGNFVACLYSLHLALGGKRELCREAPFEDVPLTDPNVNAIAWGKNHGVVNGVSETLFSPDDSLTRENICTILLRYAGYAEIKLPKKAEAAQFLDSLRISAYARTPVLACQMAGIVNGYADGLFRPAGKITREECAAMLWRVMDAAKQPASGLETVSTKAGAYDALYANFVSYDPVLPAGEAVDLSYFDDVAFVGDSVSLMLQYYCAATKALGNATFLCAGSLSSTNALWPVSSSSVHPSYQGTKMLVEDAVAASGVKKVYIMLGINNIAYGVDYASNDMVTLIDRILQKSPDVKIIVQSVTPMAFSSTIITNQLNNTQIQAYNKRMQEICAERGWSYLNVAEVLTDKDGNLPSNYCSDNGSMGIHFTYEAAAVWVDYLKTHPLS